MKFLENIYVGSVLSLVCESGQNRYPSFSYRSIWLVFVNEISKSEVKCIYYIYGALNMAFVLMHRSYLETKCLHIDA